MRGNTEQMKKIFFLCVVSLVALSGYASGGISTSGPHSFSADQCKDCHVSVPADGQKGPFQMKAPIPILCKKCHPSLMRPSHPVGFKPPPGRMPDAFPLSYNGRFTCSTCHDIHSEFVGSTGLRSYYLRYKTGEGNFCTECHDKRKISHEVLLTAHMEKKNRVIIPGLMIDDLSNQCLSCHNGVTAKNVVVGLPLCACPEEQTSHPIGMDYEKARLRTGKLKVLDKTIKLFGGKVGCGSCHDPYSKNANMLVTPNTGSALCLKCHIE